MNASGQATVGGLAHSQDFPRLNAVFPNSAGGAFVLKLSALGDALLYSTFIQGSFYSPLGFDPPTLSAERMASRSMRRVGPTGAGQW